MIIRKKKSYKAEIFFFLSIIFLLLTIVIYTLDRIIVPNVMVIAEGEMKAKAAEIIYRNALEVYTESFDYDELIKVEKDSDGYITLVRTNTMKMNSLSSQIALNTQRDLKDIGDIGIKFPLGYITKNNILSNIGPKVMVKMEPVGFINTSYESRFETAGINQTRHKIYLKVNLMMKLVIPIENKEIEYNSEIPVAETIILGRVPRTSIDIQTIEIE